jgi:hypothetical protein
MKRWILRGFTVAFFIALAVVVVGFLVMTLWNWLIPGLFGAKPIDFIQAVGLLVLSRLLLGFRGGFGRHMHWRGRMHERWARMSPEEREKFRDGMRARCGFHRKAGDGPQAP